MINKKIDEDKIDTAISMYFYTHRKQISEVMQNAFNNVLQEENLTYSDCVNVQQLENILATMQSKASGVIVRAVSRIVVDVLYEDDKDDDEF